MTKKQKYKYIWATRDKSPGSSIRIWAPGAQPKYDSGWGEWLQLGEAPLQYLCIEKFEKVFHWRPEPCTCWKMKIYFDAVCEEDRGPTYRR